MIKLINVKLSNAFLRIVKIIAEMHRVFIVYQALMCINSFNPTIQGVVIILILQIGNLALKEAK